MFNQDELAHLLAALDTHLEEAAAPDGDPPQFLTEIFGNEIAKKTVEAMEEKRIAYTQLKRDTIKLQAKLVALQEAAERNELNTAVEEWVNQ